MTPPGPLDHSGTRAVLSRPRQVLLLQLTGSPQKLLWHRGAGHRPLDPGVVGAPRCRGRARKPGRSPIRPHPSGLGSAPPGLLP